MPSSDNILSSLGDLGKIGEGMEKGLKHQMEFFQDFVYLMQNKKGEERNLAIHDLVGVAEVFAKDCSEVVENPLAIMSDPMKESRLALYELEKKYGITHKA